MCYCNSVVCSCSSYPRTASGLNYYAPQPVSPFEDAYRIALRSLEDSFEREMMTLNRFYPMDYNDSGHYYSLESDARYRFEKAKNRLHDDFCKSAQRYSYAYVNQAYGYGYANRSLNDSYYSIRQTQLDIMKYQYTYLNSTTGETSKPMPTEAKTYIVVSSAGANETPKVHTTYDEAEKEAKRLARKFPAQEFTVFTSTKKYKIAEKPVDVVVCI
jgi:hypothetical protein